MKENHSSCELDKIIAEANISLIDTYITLIRCAYGDIKELDSHTQLEILDRVKSCLSFVRSKLDIK